MELHEIAELFQGLGLEDAAPPESPHAPDTLASLGLPRTFARGHAMRWTADPAVEGRYQEAVARRSAEVIFFSVTDRGGQVLELSLTEDGDLLRLAVRPALRGLPLEYLVDFARTSFREAIEELILLH